MYDGPYSRLSYHHNRSCFKIRDYVSLPICSYDILQQLEALNCDTIVSSELFKES